MSTEAGGRDAGAASIWVLACCALLMLMAAVVTVRGLAVLARHRAEAGADLAALAAAERIGVDGDGCAAAAHVAERNGGRLRSCRLHLAPDGRSGTVDVAVALAVHLPLAGARTVVATARAGRSASGPTASAVWHADPKVVPDGASVLRSGRSRDGDGVEVSVSRASTADVPVVSVSGEVDVYSAPALKEQLTQQLRSGSSVLIVDLSDVAFLDSTGLGALVEARAAATEAGGSLPIVCNQERILKLFTITGLDGVFAIHSSVDEALAALSG